MQLRIMEDRNIKFGKIQDHHVQPPQHFKELHLKTKIVFLQLLLQEFLLREILHSVTIKAEISLVILSSLSCFSSLLAFGLVKKMY